MTLFTFASEGFGLNLNLFETNIINLAVVIFGLYKFLPGFLGKILEKRRTTILTDLKEAEEDSDNLYKEALALATADANASREKARSEIDSQRNDALNQLKSEADNLGGLIVERLLAKK